MTTEIIATAEETLEARISRIEGKVDFIYDFCIHFNEFMAANTPAVAMALAEIKPTIDKLRPMLAAMGIG